MENKNRPVLNPARAAARKKRRRRAIRNRILFGLAILALLTGLFFGIRAIVRAVRGLSPNETEESGETGEETKKPKETTEPAESTDPPETQESTEQTTEIPAWTADLEAARLIAAGYDYERAVARLREVEGYKLIPEIMEAINSFEQAETTLEEVPYNQVYHVFFHSLIVDNEVCFKMSGSWAAYNETMTTLSEFEKILQQMYDNGWVLVKLHDMAALNENGEFVLGSIMLPPGKKAFVLSLDDLSYYHYMQETGGRFMNAFAKKVVIDENGDPRCEYTERDGTVSVGNYDCVPILEDFIKEHPDFSYRGAKGCIALTGYNGILGYRTDSIYDYSADPAWAQKYVEEWSAFFNGNTATTESTLNYFARERKNYPGMYDGYDRAEERRQAKLVADRLKELGWEFASHTWGHINVQTNGLETIIKDNERWQFEVEPLIGETDTIIFAFGSDISNWVPYSEENEKYVYLHEQGFRYYCNVSTYELPNAWVQYSQTYQFIRQARANLDGYSMWKEISKDPDGRLDIFFDTESVFDPERPTPVYAVNY